MCCCCCWLLAIFHWQQRLPNDRITQHLSFFSCALWIFSSSSSSCPATDRQTTTTCPCIFTRGFHFSPTTPFTNKTMCYKFRASFTVQNDNQSKLWGGKNNTKIRSFISVDYDAALSQQQVKNTYTKWDRIISDKNCFIFLKSSFRLFFPLISDRCPGDRFLMND